MSDFISREEAENIFYQESSQFLKYKKYSQLDRDEKAEYDRIDGYETAIHNLPDAKAIPLEDAEEAVELLNEFHAAQEITDDAYNRLHDAITRNMP